MIVAAAVAVVATVIVLPIIWWTASVIVWTRRISRAPQRWVHALGGTESPDHPTGPFLYRRGVPSTKLGPAWLIAFDESDLVIIPRGLLTTARYFYRSEERPVVRVDRVRPSIWRPGKQAQITKGPLEDIDAWLAATGWTDEPLASTPTTPASPRPPGRSPSRPDHVHRADPDHWTRSADLPAPPRYPRSPNTRMIHLASRVISPAAGSMRG